MHYNSYLWCCRSWEKWSGAVGGVAKIAIRNAVAQGKSILHVNDFSEFSNDKFDACDSPTYSMKLVDTEKINEERELKPDTRHSYSKGIFQFPSNDILSWFFSYKSST